MKKSILVVEDELVTQELIKHALINAGFDVKITSKGKEAIQIAENEHPSLILLDGMLDDIDGTEVCQALKKHISTSSIPIFMLSVRSDENHQLTGLELGADDYITKPFNPKILVAKINAAFRRAHLDHTDFSSDDVITHKGLVMNLADFSVKLDGQLLNLTPVEYKLLFFLCKHPGRVYSREAILEKIRGEDVIITERTVDVHILSIRRKVGDFASNIVTVRGIGYKVAEE
ncbi:response regulator [Lentisphaera marina]|uniref:response regulator n=1 Tax=Lentisphaera marina TaxID=1111041 RepID=UPI002366E0D2|nr:response regulator [Lentisphaera marina]MDD7986629.1 response regulator [Lentisphaera marina]